MVLLRPLFRAVLADVLVPSRGATVCHCVDNNNIWGSGAAPPAHIESSRRRPGVPVVGLRHIIAILAALAGFL